jgi:signal transduction histidine kinase
VLLLARMFSGALRKVEAFAGELERTVELRTSELLAAQEKLIVAARLAEEEKIRRRISQDIHDDISSGLNKISWMSELARIKARGNKTEEMNATLDKIILSSRETVDHMIEIIWSLNPGSDNLENLLAYMRNYINKYFEDTAFNVNVQFPETIPKFDLNPELKRNLFLVMKEALHNAVKYSGARNIGLIFTVEDKGYVFIISDDGMGVVEGVVKGTGHGMENMVRRMEDVKGRFRVESAPGQGTRVILEGPLF